MLRDRHCSLWCVQLNFGTGCVMKCDGLSETEFVELAMSRKQQEQVLLGKFGICQCFCAVSVERLSRDQQHKAQRSTSPHRILERPRSTLILFWTRHVKFIRVAGTLRFRWRSWSPMQSEADPALISCGFVICPPLQGIDQTLRCPEVWTALGLRCLSICLAA